MALGLKAVINVLLRDAADTATAGRVIDAYCGLAGMASVSDPAERRRIAVDKIRDDIMQNVRVWELTQARQAVVLPADPNIN